MPHTEFLLEEEVPFDKPSFHALDDWEGQKDIYDAIATRGLQAYADGLPGIEKAFQKGDGIVRCMDERTPGGYHAGGSLILMNDEQRKHYVEAAKPKGLTSHAGCGAAALAYRILHGLPKDVRLDLETVDAFAREEVQRIAGSLGIPYAGHIEADQLKGDPARHAARCIYYVGTSEFDPSQAEGLPAGFVIDRRYMQPTYALKEVEVAMEIAMDPTHGFGDLLCADQPLYVFVIGGEDDFSVRELEKEVAHLADEHEGKIKVEAFSR